MRPLRVVQISPFPVLPTTTGGKVRIAQLARALCALGVEVTIIAPYHMSQRRALWQDEPFALKAVPYPFLVPFLLTDRPIPYGALVSFHPGYRALLPVDLGAFDICQFEHPAFVDLARTLPADLPVIYDSQNVEFDYVSAECPDGLIRRYAGRRVRNLERQLIERSAHVFACSEHDRRRFGAVYAPPPERVTVLENGVDLKAVDAMRARARDARPLPPGVKRRAVFAGSAVAHNHAAVRALLEQVAPQLEGEVEFIVVGGCARLFRGAVRPNVRFDVDGELADYASPDVVGLNPVFQGSGTSLKLLQYLAFDMPVLSTSFGMRGFEDLKPWMAAAELDEFPAALRGELPATRGVREVLANYEWQRLARHALRVYETVTGRSAAS